MLRRWWKRLVRGRHVDEDADKRQQAATLLEMALDPVREQKRRDRIVALTDAKRQAYDSAKELHRQAYGDLSRRYIALLAPYAPKGHRKWWDAQIKAMVREAMKAAGDGGQ